MNCPVRYLITAVVVMAVMTAGCHPGGKKVAVGPGLTKDDLPLTVAVLPFENRTNDPGAAELVRKSFFNQFASKRYRDIELHEIDAALARDGLLEDKGIASASPEQLGRLLGAQGLLYGVVTSYDTVYLGAYSNVSVGLEATLIDCRTGRKIWHNTHKTRSHEGGIPLDPISAIPTLFRTLYNVSDMQKIITCDKLTRAMTATMPEPDAGRAFQLPVIELLAHDAKGQWKKAGDRITVSLKGEPAMAAAFDIGKTIINIPMNEIEAGIYKGVYQVRPGDMADNVMVTARLMDGSGRAASYVDPVGLVRIDTRAPAPPETLSAVSRDASVHLAWPDTDDKDLAGYMVYRSLRPKTGFEKISRTEQPLYVDPKLDNFQTYYYRVTGVDLAGNESLPTATVSSVPLPPGPTRVSKDITENAVWFSQASPYLLQKTITVPKGVTLTIEPGCAIQSDGPGLIIKGTLIAVGTPENPIRFSAISPKTKDTSWEGILFDNTDDNNSSVQHCRIENAVTALVLISSSPGIAGNLMVENEIGIDIQDFSSPKITENRIVHNRKTGIYCTRSAPKIQQNKIMDNQTGGIRVSGGTPVIRRNTLQNNAGFNLWYEAAGDEILAVPDNWWGTTDAQAILDTIQGQVSCPAVLDAPWPGGNSIRLAPDARNIEQVIEKARELMENQDYAEARQQLYRILAGVPGHAKANFLAGLLHHRQGHVQKALENMAAATRADPDNVDYLYTLGMLEMEAGHMENAVETWQKVVEKDPAHTNARHLLMIYKHPGEHPSQ